MTDIAQDDYLTAEAWAACGRMERIPYFEVTGNVGWTLLCFKMAGFSNIYSGMMSCTILDSNENAILLAAIACFMRRTFNHVDGFFEVTIPVYLSGKYENHFRMTRETCELLLFPFIHLNSGSTGRLKPTSVANGIHTFR